MRPLHAAGVNREKQTASSLHSNVTTSTPALYDRPTQAEHLCTETGDTATQQTTGYLLYTYLTTRRDKLTT